MRHDLGKPPAGKRLRRLKARQRKKLHAGEFQQLTFEVNAPLHTTAEGTALLNALLDMIESRKLFYTGYAGPDEISGLVSAPTGSPTEEDHQAILTWLKHRPEVSEATAGDFFDLWYV